MTNCKCFNFSTIGQKQLMAVAGLWLGLFVLMHAAGNMLLFVGEEAYNKYSHALTSNPVIYLAEAGLLLFIFFHIVIGVVITIRNKRSRPVGYVISAGGEKATSWVTKTMWLQGLIILVFVALHLLTFKYGPEYDVEYNGVRMRNIFQLVHEVFQSPYYVGWYVFSVTILCFHLSHGIYSGLQTLGAHHPDYMPKIKCASVIYGILVGGMFALQPLYMWLYI